MHAIMGRSGHVTLMICVAAPLLMGQSCWLLQNLLPATNPDSGQTQLPVDGTDGTADDGSTDGGTTDNSTNDKGDTDDGTDDDGTDDAATAPYEIHKLPDGDSYATGAIAVNDTGQAVGTMTLYGLLDTSTVSWREGASGCRRLWGPGLVSDINNQGWATGLDGDRDDIICSIMRAVYLADGVVHRIKAVEGRNASVPISINNLGEIVGYSYVEAVDCIDQLTPRDEQYVAFLYREGQVTGLGTLPGDTESSARSINDHGKVVGLSYNEDQVNVFLWENGTMTKLETLRGFVGTFSCGKPPSFAADYSVTLHINNADQILVAYPDVAYILENDGAKVDLMDTPLPDGAHVTGFNDLGQVVGYSRGIPGIMNWEGRGFLWEDGTVTDFLELLPEGAGWNNVAPRDINNVGQIVGYGRIDGGREAFIMTPTE